MTTTDKKPSKSKSSKSSAVGKSPNVSPEMQAQIHKMRDTLLARLGQVITALIGVPRYAHQSIGDLQSICLAPITRDRIAIASLEPKDESQRKDTLTAPLLGIAIWASVSPEVDKKIQEQTRAGVFPVKLAPADWNSGEIIWLLDVIAPNAKLSTSVIANFRQVLDAKKLSSNEMRLHPVIKRMVGGDILEKMGAKPMGKTVSAKPDSKTSKATASAASTTVKTRKVKSGATGSAKAAKTVN